MLQGGFTVRQVSTTAAFSAIRCRCGRTFPCHPVFTVFQGGFTVRQVSTTAVFSAILCRCGKGRRTWMALEVPLRGGVMARVFHTGSVFRDSVPLWSYVSLPPRLHGILCRFYGQSGFHNGSVSRDSVPLRQRTKDVNGSGSTSLRGDHGSCLPQRQRFPRFGAVVAYGREESSSQTQPLCNVQHVTKIYLIYYQRHTFQQFAGPGRYRRQTAIQPHIFTSPACVFFQSI